MPPAGFLPQLLEFASASCPPPLPFQMFQMALRIVSRRVAPVSLPPASRPISTSVQEANPTRYCRAMVQKHDYEGFLTSFAYGKHTRDAYFALKAFNVSSIPPWRRSSWDFRTSKMMRLWQTELAMIPDNISQPIIAQMRFQWWKESVKSVYEVRLQGFKFRLVEGGELICPRAVHQSSLLHWLCMNLRSYSESRNTICRGLLMQG
jgi:hypothetical protein